MTTTSSSTSSTSLDALVSALSSLGTSSTSSTSTSTTGTTKGVGGLASGIDTTALIDAMIAADRASTAMLEKRKAQFEKRQEAVRTLNTKLLTAQLDLSSLKMSGTLGSRSVTSSSDTVATGTATSSSAVGTTFSGTVTAVAKAHQTASAGQTSSSTAFGAGTLSIKVGNGTTKTVSIDAASSSLTDIAKSINTASVGVTASVVNQGGTTPYRLVLTSNTTGADNTVSVTTDGANATLDGLFTGATTITAAADAALTIGEGASAITLTSTTNTFTDVAPGLNLTVKGKGDVTLTVATDTDTAKEAITTFVTDLNDALTYLKDNSGYDTDTKAAGVLIQESDLRSAVNQLARTLIDTVPGLPKTMNSASALGISFDEESGTFEIDEDALTSAIEADPNGVQALFQNGGTSSSTAVSFGALSSKTRTTSPFRVSITQPATQATASATAALASSTTIDSTNNKISLLINDSTYTVSLPAKTYSQAELVEQLQKSLNAATIDTPSNSVLVSMDSAGQLQLRTKAYGSANSIDIQSTSTALTALSLAAGKTTGTNVAGTINGKAATGTGQILEGATGTDAEGLTLVVTATAAISDVQVTARKGLAQALQERFSALTDVEYGVITRKNTAYNDIIADQEERIDKNDERLTQRRKYYEAKFTAMETLTAKYQSLATYLTQFSTSSSSS